MSCPDCFSGDIRKGEPQGKMIQLHGLDTYVAEPPANGKQANKGIIVIIPDALGIDFINNKLLADAYARKGGYKVYLPDFMRGHSCPVYLLEALKVVTSPGNWLVKPYHVLWGAYTFLSWRYHNGINHTFPVVKKFFEDLRNEGEGATQPVGVAGFCWGGKHTVLLSHQVNFVDVDVAQQGSATSSSKKKPLLDAGFVGHPSFLDIPTDVEKLAVPVAWALAEQDHHIKAPHMTDMVAHIVANKPDEHKGEVKVYPGCRHGFCVRVDQFAGDVNGFATQAGEAEDQAIEWFNAQFQTK